MKTGFFLVLFVLPLAGFAQDPGSSGEEAPARLEGAAEDEAAGGDAAEPGDDFDDLDSLFGDAMLEYAEEPDED